MASNFPEFNRYSFPQGFTFGTSSSAYQYEGEAKSGGKGPSVWDTFTEDYSERITDHSNGDVAVDFYHFYEEDVKLMREMNMDAFRFSISWPRILPFGKLSYGINEEGIKFYNDLIDSLIENGIQPFVTIFHWDTPQALQDKYGGFLSPNIVDDFRDFAELCFQRFGDRVKHWITLNEPTNYSCGGYDDGLSPPGKCSCVSNCPCRPQNMSGSDIYTASHHLLLAHAAAAKLYKDKFQAYQKGKIGITLVSHWFKPYSDSKADQAATKRSLDFILGWFMDPLTKGDYPENMHNLVGKRLPKFSAEEAVMLKESYDFIGINYYTTFYAKDVDGCDPKNVGYMNDARVAWTGERNGIPIGPKGASEWLYIYPEGIYCLLNYVKDNYGNPTIYVTENGFDEFNDSSLPLDEALKDPVRIKYHYDHLMEVLKCINENGVKVMGYFVWSFLDNFEWSAGYTVRFGLYFIDYKNGLKRYPKTSVSWFTQFLRRKLWNNQLEPENISTGELLILNDKSDGSLETGKIMSPSSANKGFERNWKRPRTTLD